MGETSWVAENYKIAEHILAESVSSIPGAIFCEIIEEVVEARGRLMEVALDKRRQSSLNIYKHCQDSRFPQDYVYHLYLHVHGRVGPGQKYCFALFDNGANDLGEAMFSLAAELGVAQKRVNVNTSRMA